MFAGVFAVQYWQSFNGDNADAAGFTWQSQVVDNSAFNTFDQTIQAIDTNTQFIVYNDATNNSVKFAKTENGGNTWDLSDIDTNIAGTYVDMEALDANNIVVIYSAGGSGVDDLRMAVSTNGGDSWTLSTIVSNNDIRNPNLDVLDMNNIAVSYYYNQNAFDARFAVTSNGGTNWLIIDPLPGINGGTAVDVYFADASNIYLMYEDGGDTYCAVSTNGGSSFTAGNLIDANPPGGFTQEESIAGVDANTIYFSYGRPLRVAKTTNACGSFTLTDVGSADSGFFSRIDVLDINNIFISTADNGTSTGYVYYTTNAGTNWSESILPGSVDSGVTVSAISASRVFTSYRDGSNDLGYASGTFGPHVITSTTPTENANNVAADTDISVVFDTSLNTSSVTASSFIVRGSQTGVVPGAFSFSTTTLTDDTITFNPTSDFNAGERVTVTVRDTVLASSGGSVDPETYSFITAGGAGGGVPNVLTGVVINAAGSNPSDLAAGDINGDGHADILVATSTRTNVLTNDGTGVFTEIASLTAPSRAVELGDIDNDGDLDFLGAGAGASMVTNIGTNDGAGNFTVTTVPQDNALDAQFIDADNDGDLDFVLGGKFSVPYEVKVFFNDGAGNFSLNETFNPASRPSAIAVADIDLDGYQDFVVTLASPSNNLIRYINDGDGTFTEQSALSAGVSTPQAVFAENYDNDGDLDFIITSSSSTAVIRNNAGTLSLATFISATGINPLAARLSDFTGDGNLDAVSIGTSGVSLARGTGSSFAQYELLRSQDGFSPSSRSFTTADFNNDGLIDQAVGSTYSGINNLHIVLNTAAVSPSVTVRFPNGGETVTKNSTENILWSSQDDALHTIALELDDGGGFVAIGGASNLIPDSSFVSDSEFGASGSGDGQLSSPNGVAVDSQGNVYVANTSNNRIEKYDDSGTFIGCIGGGVSGLQNPCISFASGTGSNQFDAPQGVEVSLVGNIYVADTGNDRIVLLNSSGAQYQTIGSSGSGDGQFNSPVDIAFRPGTGNTFYVVDQGNHRIQQFLLTGVFLGCFGGGVSGNQTPCTSFTAGSANTQFDTPTSIDFDTSNIVYIADQGNNRVQLWNSSSLTFQASITDGGAISSPSGVAVGPRGNVYITSTGSSQYYVYDSTTEIGQYGAAGTGLEEFQNPTGITVTNGGVIYITENTADKVEKILPGGTYTWSTPNIDTSTARIRATATDSLLLAGQDTSDADFSIGVAAPPADEGGGGSFLQQSQTPTTPTPGVGEAISSTSIQWNFTDNASNETGFRLVNEQNEPLVETDQSNSSFITEDGLNPNTVYSGRKLLALGQLANSSISEAFDAVTTQAPMVTPKIISVGPNSVEVGINESFPNLAEGNSGLQFEFVTGDSVISSAVLSSGWVQDEQFTFTDIEPGQQFQVRVIARNQDSVETDYSDFTGIETTPEEEVAAFTIGLSGTLVGGDPIPTPMDPSDNILVTVTVANIGTLDGTNVLVTIPVPEFLSFVPGSLIVSGDSQSDNADNDIGQGNGNAVSVIWPVLPAGQAEVIQFQFAFDQTALIQQKQNEEAQAQALNTLAGVNAFRAAANPLISIQASVNSSEVESITSSSSLTIEPDLTLLDVGDEPVEEPIVEDPEPEVTPIPVTPPTPPQGPTTVVPSDPAPIVEAPETIPEPTVETEALVLTSQVEANAEELVFMGTTSEPNTVVMIKIASQEFTVTSDNNGVWTFTVSTAELGINVEDAPQLRIESIAEKDGLVSNLVEKEVILTQASEGEIVIDRAILVSQNQLVTTVQQAQVFAQENQEEVQTALAIAAPVIVVASAPLIGYLPFIPTLLIHGFAALLGISARRKEKRFYGIVYNAISKDPIGLSIVRVYNAETNKLAATKVTDKYGRYDLLLPKGKYRLEVSRPGFSFPTAIVSGVQDGMYQELYQVQQPLIVGDDTVSPPDIPIDPVDQKREQRRANLLKKVFTALQQFGHWFVIPLLFIGFAVSLFLLYLAPENIVNWVYVLLYGLLVLLQLKLRPTIEKAWGVVYDIASGAILPLTTVQLVDSKHHKIVKSRLSDYQGRYSFLVHPGDYVLNADHEGFEQVPHTEKQDPYHHPIEGEIHITKENQHLTGDIPMKSRE